MDNIELILNPILHQGGYKTMLVRAYDRESGYTHHQRILLKKKVSSNLLDLILGNTWTQIGEVDLNVDPKCERVIISIRRPFLGYFDEIHALMNRVIKTAKTNKQMEDNADFIIKLAPEK